MSRRIVTIVILFLVAGVAIKYGILSNNNKTARKSDISAISKQSQNVIIKPHLYSNTKDGKKLEIIAARAENISTKAILYDVQAIVKESNEKSLTMQSDKASFDISTRILNIEGDVLIKLFRDTLETLTIQSDDIIIDANKHLLKTKSTTHTEILDLDIISQNLEFDMNTMNLKTENIFIKANGEKTS